jgi:hypothetical protein
MQDHPLNFGFLESATESLRAIAHPHRLLIVEMLYKEPINFKKLNSGKL